jgi:hypothetical protein
LTVSRTYYPVHNIGHFRYLEASQVSVDEQPAGDITVWDEILFPFDPAKRNADLQRSAVERTLGVAQEVEERYACDATGVVTATVRNLTSGYGQDYRLGRWSGKEKVVKPKATKRSRKAST